jgi:hypothetical protein
MIQGRDAAMPASMNTSADQDGDIPARALQDADATT